MARMPKAIIVGGGASGLAAAYTLRRRHGGKIEVTVLEASDHAGGRIASEEIDGFTVSTGASVLHESFETTNNLAESLGVSMKKAPRKKGGHLYHDGRLWGMYVGGSFKQTVESLRTVLSFRLLTAGGMWQSMRFFGRLKARSKDIDFQDHSGMLDLDVPESFSEFMKANSLAEYLEQAAEIDINCFTCSDSERVGAAFGMALIWLWTLNQSARACLPERGVGELAQALVRACAEDTRLSMPVRRIVCEDGVVKGVAMAGPEGHFIEADAVVCATPATQAVKIIPDLPPEIRDIVSRVAYSTAINVAVGLDANILPEDSHAVIFPPKSGTFLTMVSNLESMAPGAAPDGKALVHALMISEHARKLLALSDAEIKDRVVAEMRRYFPAMPAQPLFVRVYRWPEAICLAPGGMLKEIYEMREQKANALPRGLFLAGDYMRMPSCNGAMLSGVAAAEDCASHVLRSAV